MDTQNSANLKDGVSQTPLKGQSEKIVNSGNPMGVSGLKDSRNTGKIQQGTDFLRKNTGGVKMSDKSE